ncbi:MAG TPA: hypothetical protein VLD59_09875 [Steroidobacteraceae bacterium]|nr:hypothetical protein [Steroidobacteraceae bacterium]
MNAQTASSSRPMKPLLGIDPFRVIPAARAKPKAPAEPSEEEAYGCVEWFNYDKHPLRAAALAKATYNKS